MERKNDSTKFWEGCGFDTADFSEPEEYDEWENAPDYLNSLDAMHDAIMAQPPVFRKAMRAWLWALTDQMSAHFADANAMAYAFLLTI